MLEKERITSIDGLKGIVCLMIVLGHLSYFKNTNLWYISKYSGKGVEIFMVISGFMMEYNYTQKIYKMSFAQFFSKRYFRIMPLYWITNTMFHLMWILGGAMVGHDVYTTKYCLEKVLLEYSGFISLCGGGAN